MKIRIFYFLFADLKSRPSSPRRLAKNRNACSRSLVGGVPASSMTTCLRCSVLNSNLKNAHWHQPNPLPVQRPHKRPRPERGSPPHLERRPKPKREPCSTRCDQNSLDRTTLMPDYSKYGLIPASASQETKTRGIYLDGLLTTSLTNPDKSSVNRHVQRT